MAVALGSLILAAFLVSTATAALHSVAGYPTPSVDAVTAFGPSEEVAFSLANGFPLWYRDNQGVKLELCLDQGVPTADGHLVFPCLTEEPFTGAPLSFPGNFGPEAFWWIAEAFGTFSSRQGGQEVPGGDALLVLALEAGFAGELGARDGDQVAFGRIRLRINVPVNGTYRVTHPYGQRTYVVANAPATNREINQTQDVGNFHLPGPPPAGDFTLVLGDNTDFIEPGPFNPSLNIGIVDEVGASIGPFLVAAKAPGGAPLPFLQAADGRQYLADPGLGLVQLTVPVTRGPNGNVFRIELIADETGHPPEEDGSYDGFFLNADGTQVVEFDQFVLSGKIFNDGPNLPPTAVPDFFVTARGTVATLDVLANDLDPVAPGTNEHGLDRQALGLPTDPHDLLQEIVLTRPVTTAQGGTVQRQTSLPTGRSTLRYTPPSDFTGIDTFTYVGQDTGGLTSAPTAVTIVVEEIGIDRADFRPRTGRWHIAGRSSHAPGNTITLFGAPRSFLAGSGEVPAVTTLSTGVATLRVSSSAIDFVLRVDSLPATPVTQAHLHLGEPGENGPILFFLFDSAVEGTFQGSKSGALTPFDLLTRPVQGISTFADAVAAILDGRTYVNVHTTGNPEGEIRGQLRRPQIGTAPVQPNGRWVFSGKSEASPGMLPAVAAESANGIRTPDRQLRLR